MPIIVRVKKYDGDDIGLTVIRAERIDYVPGGMSKLYDAAGNIQNEIPTFMILSTEDEPR